MITHSSRHTTTKGNLHCHVTPNTMPRTGWGMVCCGMRTQDGWHGCPSGKPMPTHRIQQALFQQREQGSCQHPGCSGLSNTAVARTSALLIDGRELAGAVGLHQTVYPIRPQSVLLTGCLPTKPPARRWRRSVATSCSGRGACTHAQQQRPISHANSPSTTPADGATHK